MRCAVLDIGTNSVRYLVGEHRKGDWHDIDFGGAITGLGRNLDEKGELSSVAIEETIEAISTFVRQLESLRFDQLTVLVTEPVRSATNGELFLKQVEQLTDTLPFVLSPEEEAKLAFVGATSGLRMHFRDETSIAVSDIGGGSSEFALGQLRQPKRWLSVPIGSRRLTEQFLTEDPPSREQIKSASIFAREKLQPATSLLEDTELLLLAGGTACAFGILQMQLDKFEPRLIHGLPVRIWIVQEWIEKLSTMPLEERNEVRGMEQGRGEVIIAGLLLLSTVMEMAHKATVLLSARSVLHGFLLSKVFW